MGSADVNLPEYVLADRLDRPVARQDVGAVAQLAAVVAAPAERAAVVAVMAQVWWISALTCRKVNVLTTAVGLSTVAEPWVPIPNLPWVSWPQQ